MPGVRPLRGLPVASGSSVLPSQNRTKSPVARLPWCLHDPVRWTQAPKNLGRIASCFARLSAWWRWRTGWEDDFLSDPRDVFPGGASPAVQEPVLAEPFTDRVSPAICKRKRRRTLSVALRAYHRAPVVSDAAISGSCWGFPLGLSARGFPCPPRCFRFFTPVCAVRPLSPTGTPSVKVRLSGVSRKDAVRGQIMLTWGRSLA